MTQTSKELAKHLQRRIHRSITFIEAVEKDFVLHVKQQFISFDPKVQNISQLYSFIHQNIAFSGKIYHLIELLMEGKECDCRHISLAMNDSKNQTAVGAT